MRIVIKNAWDHLLFSVSDTGIGISLEDQQRLFRHFERIESAEGREIEGVGLGLKVCQLLVEAHGGKIWLQSAPGQGSTFFFTLSA